MKEQVGPKSFVFRFSSGTSPETILDNLMDEVLALEEGLPKHGWRLLDTVVNVTWNIYISETLPTPIDVLFKKLYVIESDCEDGSIKRAIFGATDDSILLLGLTQWNSETKTSTDLKSMGYCSFVPQNLVSGWALGYFYRLLWGIKFRLSEDKGYDRCCVALFVCKKWCAISRISNTFGLCDTDKIEGNNFYSNGLEEKKLIKSLSIQGLLGVFEHKRAHGDTSHSYINSAILGCGAGIKYNWDTYILPNWGCGVFLNDVLIFPGIRTTYPNGGIYEPSLSHVIAMPAAHMTEQALGLPYSVSSENRPSQSKSIAMAVRSNKNPFTNTPNTNRLWLYELDADGLNPKFRGETFGIRCMSDESAGWMEKVQVVGEDRITPESYFVIPSGLISSPDTSSVNFENRFALLIEA